MILIIRQSLRRKTDWQWQVLNEIDKKIGDPSPTTSTRLRNYRPQTKSREGTVFTGVCLSVILSTGVGRKSSNASWDRSHGRVHPNINLRTCPLESDIWWWSLETCSNFGDLPSPPPERHLVVATETEAVYDFQADGMHPTGMLSSWYYFCHNIF